MASDEPMNLAAGAGGRAAERVPYEGMSEEQVHLAYQKYVEVFVSHATRKKTEEEKAAAKKKTAEASAIKADLEFVKRAIRMYFDARGWTSAPIEVMGEEMVLTVEDKPSKAKMDGNMIKSAFFTFLTTPALQDEMTKMDDKEKSAFFYDKLEQWRVERGPIKQTVNLVKPGKITDIRSLAMP